ncbi:MAG: TolC family protein [bacterium]
MKTRSISILTALVITAGVLVPAGGVFAEESPLVLDVDTAVSTALENNLTLAREETVLDIKEKKKNTSWNGFLPRMNASVNLTRLNVKPEDPMADLGIPGYTPSDPSRWILSARFQAQLTIVASLFQNIKQTRLEYRAGRVTMAKAKLGLERDVKKQFYQILLLEEQREVTSAGIENALERYEQARVNYENGLIPRYQLLTARVAYENSKPGLEQLENGIDAAKLALKMSLGVDLERDIVLEGEIVTSGGTVEGDEMLRKAIEGNLDLQEMQAQIYTVEQAVKLARSAMYPSFSISWSFDPAFQGNPFTDPVFADVANDWKQQSGALTFTVSQAIDPLLPASSTRVRIAETENQIEQLALSKAEARLGVEMQVRSTVRELEQAVSSIRAKELTVEVAEEAYELAEEAYAAGTMELLEVKNAEQELDQARYDLLDARYTYLSGMLDLEYLAGGGLE